MVILVFQNNETAAVLVFQTNPVVFELYSYINAFFRSNNFAYMSEWNHSIAIGRSPKFSLFASPPSSPQRKKYVSIVIIFCWEDCNTQEKSATKVMQNFGKKQGVLWEISISGYIWWSHR